MKTKETILIAGACALGVIAGKLIVEKMREKAIADAAKRILEYEKFEYDKFEYDKFEYDKFTDEQ